MLIWWSLSYFLVICHFRTIEKIPPISQSHGPNLTRDHFWPGGDFFLLLWIYFKITKIFMSRNHALNHWIWITVFSPFMPYFVNDERGGGLHFIICCEINSEQNTLLREKKLAWLVQIWLSKGMIQKPCQLKCRHRESCSRRGWLMELGGLPYQSQLTTSLKESSATFSSKKKFDMWSD